MSTTMTGRRYRLEPTRSQVTLKTLRPGTKSRGVFVSGVEAKKIFFGVGVALYTAIASQASTFQFSHTVP